MALVWQKEVKGDRYEVRSAGKSVRLYSNGIFHSHYNPDHCLSNNIWDLLILPAFFQSPRQIKHVLLMGVGGGTAIKLLNRHVRPSDKSDSAPVNIIGLEINPLHIQIARKYFKVTTKEAKIICTDGVKWIQNYQGTPFDMIIDDMFGHASGEYTRPVKLNAEWFRLLNKNLSRDGVVVINTTDSITLRECAYVRNKSIRPMFQSAYYLQRPGYENRIGVFFKLKNQKKDLLKNIRNLSDKKLSGALQKLNYKLSHL